MCKVVVTLILAVSPFLACAQGTEGVQRSSSPLGMRIQGNAQQEGAETRNANNSNASSPASEGNAVANTASSAKSRTQIQGNTSINASARNLNAVAAGRSSAAGNEVGAIGK